MPAARDDNSVKFREKECQTACGAQKRLNGHPSFAHYIAPYKIFFARDKLRSSIVSTIILCETSGVLRRVSQQTPLCLTLESQKEAFDMKLVVQFFVIVIICAIGQGISNALPIAFPGSVISMILLLGLLLAGIVKPKMIDRVSEFLLDTMALFFIPAGVAVMGSFGVLHDSILKLLIICVITTVLVFFATSSTVSFVVKLQSRSHSDEEVDAA